MFKLSHVELKVIHVIRELKFELFESSNMYQLTQTPVSVVVLHLKLILDGISVIYQLSGLVNVGLIGA